MKRVRWRLLVILGALLSSAGFLHDFLLLSGVAALHHFLEYLQRQPCHQRQQDYLEQEWAVDVADLEVLPEDNDAANVRDQRDDDGEHHFAFDLGHLAEHVEHLDDDERSEGDADNVDEGLVELRHRHEHDQASLNGKHRIREL